jgi:hypothetical protein
MPVGNAIEYWLLPEDADFTDNKYQPSDTDYIPGAQHTQRMFMYKNHDKLIWTFFEGPPNANGKPDGIDVNISVDVDCYDRFVKDENIIKYVEFIG